MAGFGLAGMGAFLTGDDVAGATADTLGGDRKVFGRKPKIADFQSTILSDEQRKAAEENVANYDSIAAMLDKLIPGFSDMIKQGMETSGAMMRGEIPQDVQDSIMRDDAFQAFQGGYAGTGTMDHNLVARDFGLTSLDLMAKGQNSAQAWTKLAQTSYDPFIIKTMEQAGTTAANNAGTQATDQFRFNTEAAPDPAAAAKFAIDSAIGMQMLSFGLGAAGGAIGGAGGAAAASGGRASAAPMANDWYANAGGAYTYDPSTGQYRRGQPSVWGGS